MTERVHPCRQQNPTWSGVRGLKRGEQRAAGANEVETRAAGCLGYLETQEERGILLCAPLSDFIHNVEKSLIWVIVRNLLATQTTNDLQGLFVHIILWIIWKGSSLVRNVLLFLGTK